MEGELFLRTPLSRLCNVMQFDKLRFCLFSNPQSKVIFGSVYIGVLWHQVKNYYNFQYGITSGYIEFDYRTHAGLFPKLCYKFIRVS